VTPLHGPQRGAHVAIANPHGFAVAQALVSRNVIGDYRAPNVIRSELPPLYTRYSDVWTAAEALADVLDAGEWSATGVAAGNIVT
jgi:kynureninase